MTMITPSYLGETIEYSSLHACRSTLEDPTLDNNQVYVTSQNHGYCINPDSLGDTEFDLWFSNVDDKTVEGIKHQNKKCIAVQFHPEASPGPYDCKFIFDELKNIMEEGKTGKT